MLAIRDWALESTGSTWLVRFNPDAYTVNGTRIQTAWNSRSDTLSNLIERAQVPEARFQLTFVYYDLNADMRPLIFHDPHMPLTLRSAIRDYDLGLQRLV